MIEPTRQEKWDYRFLKLAKEVASWSKDPSTKVGAVLVRPDLTIASLGYNGFPRGFNDYEALYNDRKEKYAYVVHAEANAIVAAREPLHGFCLYTYPFQPCVECMKLVVQSGIQRIVSIHAEDEVRSRWADSFNRAEMIAIECRLDMTLYQNGV